MGRLRDPSGLAPSADMESFKRVTVQKVLFALFVAVLFAGTVVYPILELMFGPLFFDE
jgi:hypothetical protein